MQVATWTKQWAQGQGLILPNWYPEDGLSFGVLQYSNLDEQQFRAKLSQLPRGMKLYFQIWKPGQISPPVSMERQEAVFQGLRSYAAQFAVTIEKKSDRRPSKTAHRRHLRPATEMLIYSASPGAIGATLRSGFREAEMTPRSSANRK